MSLFQEPALVFVAEFEGTFRINPQSHIFRRLVLNGYYEPILAELGRMLIDPERDVIDVGANVGFFTVLSAKHTNGKVCAVEPTENALALLKGNISHNCADRNVVIFEGVVAGGDGEIPIDFIAGMEEYSSVCGISHPSVSEKEVVTKRLVRCITLEGLVTQECLDPGFIKVDVEGAEGKVFSGGWSVIERCRPILISEFSPRLLERSDTDWKVLIERFGKSGYRLIDPVMPKVALGQREFGDLLAVPEEKYSTRELMEIVHASHSKAGFPRNQSNRESQGKH